MWPGTQASSFFFFHSWLNQIALGTEIDVFLCRGTGREKRIVILQNALGELRAEEVLPFSCRSKCRSKSIKRKPAQVCFIRSGPTESGTDAAVRSRTSADFNLNVTGPNASVWNKCSFEPPWKITWKSAHGGKPPRGHRVAAVMAASHGQYTKKLSLIRLIRAIFNLLLHSLFKDELSFPCLFCFNKY